MDETIDTAGSGDSWWQDTLKTIIQGAVDYKRVELAGHGVYQVDQWGRPVYQGQPVQNPQPMTATNKAMVIGAAVLGVAMLIVLVKKL